MPSGVDILHKRKTIDFVPGDLGPGEVGIQTSNNHLYFSTDGIGVVDLSALLAGGGGGSAPVTRAVTVTVPRTESGSFEHEETFGLVGVTTAQTINAWFAPGFDLDENTADMLGPATVVGEAGNGLVTLHLKFDQPVVGPVKLFYQVLTVT